MSRISDYEVKQLIDSAHKGDKEARDKLISENMGLIGSIVKRFSGRGYDQEDLFQIGAIGLIKAVDRFDTSYQVAFSTYAVPMIMGEIKRFLRDDGLIKVSRSVKETAQKAKLSEEKLTSALGRRATVEEIAKDIGLTREEVALSLAASVAPDSLYAPCYDDENTLMIDKVVSKESEEERTVNKIALRQLLGALPEREQQIMYLRYYGEKTQATVAKKLGISQVQVSRIEKKIIMKLRTLADLNGSG